MDKRARTKAREDNGRPRQEAAAKRVKADPVQDRHSVRGIPRKPPPHERVNKLTSLPRFLKAARLARRFCGSGARTAWREEQQRCTVVVKYSRQSHHGKSARPGRRTCAPWRRHGDYLARPCAQVRPGEPLPRKQQLGFTAAPNRFVSIPERLDAWEKSGDPRMWKIILSPQRGGDMDLVAFTRAVMEQIATDHGYQLDWVAVVHRNTDYPHVHVAMRGVDRCGRDVRMENSYVRFRIREIAMDHATRQLGYRFVPDRPRRNALVELAPAGRQMQR